MRITSNYHVRELRCWNDLPVDQQEFFDYLDDEEKWDDRFVFAYGSWHDVFDAQVIGHDPRPGWDFPASEDSPLREWDAIATDSAFSGVVFRFLRGDLRDLYSPDEYAYVQVGRAFTP